MIKHTLESITWSLYHHCPPASKNGATSGFGICFPIGSQHRLVPGVPTQTRLESSIKKFKSHVNASFIYTLLMCSRDAIPLQVLPGQPHRVHQHTQPLPNHCRHTDAARHPHLLLRRNAARLHIRTAVRRPLSNRAPVATVYAAQYVGPQHRGLPDTIHRPNRTKHVHIEYSICSVLRFSKSRM